ncbi:hypothetical protein [Paenibacillus sp. JCM 10914]
MDKTRKGLSNCKGESLIRPDIGEAEKWMYRKQEMKLAVVCFIVAGIMLYAAVKACIRYLHYFG